MLNIGDRIEKIEPYREKEELANHGTIIDKYLCVFGKMNYLVKWDNGDKYLISEYDEGRTFKKGE